MDKNDITLYAHVPITKKYDAITFSVEFWSVSRSSRSTFGQSTEISPSIRGAAIHCWEFLRILFISINTVPSSIIQTTWSISETAHTLFFRTLVVHGVREDWALQIHRVVGMSRRCRNWSHITSSWEIKKIEKLLKHKKNNQQTDLLSFLWAVFTLNSQVCSF